MRNLPRFGQIRRNSIIQFRTISEDGCATPQRSGAIFLFCVLQSAGLFVAAAYVSPRMCLRGRVPVHVSPRMYFRARQTSLSGLFLRPAPYPRPAYPVPPFLLSIPSSLSPPPCMCSRAPSRFCSVSSCPRPRSSLRPVLTVSAGRLSKPCPLSSFSVPPASPGRRKPPPTKQYPAPKSHTAGTICCWHRRQARKKCHASACKIHVALRPEFSTEKFHIRLFSYMEQ